MNTAMKLCAQAVALVLLLGLPLGAAAEAPEEPDHNVWWGNRSVSYANYMRFDRIDTSVVEAPEPVVFDKIFFDLDKSVLRPKSKEVCQEVVDYMKTHPEDNVTIEGHCCDLASDAYNVALGQRRASSVKKYLVEHGIAPVRISTETYGESRPWVGVETRDLNRRAIVIVLEPAEK